MPVVDSEFRLEDWTERNEAPERPENVPSERPRSSPDDLRTTYQRASYKCERLSLASEPRMDGGANVSAVSTNGSGTSRTAGPASHGKPRSCALCAKRKVSCDKQYPCGRCQRAGIRCVLPPLDPRPRWARRLVQSSSDEARPVSQQPLPAAVEPEQVLDKVQSLEALTQSLRAELEQARALSVNTAGTHHSKGSSTSAADVHPTIRLAKHTPYPYPERGEDLSGQFWSRVDHELADLKGDAHHSEHDDTDMLAEDNHPTANQPSSAPAVHHRSTNENMVLSAQSSAATPQDTSSLQPLASQVPFLIEVYTERVHSITCLPHIPSLKKLLRRNRSRGQEIALRPDEEALLFAIYYAALCSMDDEEVVASFNVAKDDLASGYRKGFEAALAKANFLSNPSDTVLQATLIFLTLARLHDSPKYLWMMTGLIIRMGRFLRYHEDGSGSKTVSPFHADIQRRVWWNLCAMDLRATEDQGTELAISQGSFTTRLPLNVEDSDLWPEMEQAPRERSGLTQVSLLCLCSKVTRGTQKLIAAGSTATIEDRVRILDDLAQELDRDFFSITNQSEHPAYLSAAGTMRVFLGRLTLLAFVPTLCASRHADFSVDLRNKMLVAAIEIAELNHALNTEPSCQAWRWVYQTSQHWHAVVFLLIEICRSSWSPTMERAWVSLQSPWLLPAHAPSYQNPTVLVPLKRLMMTARNHRDEEIVRLRSDPSAAELLEQEDRQQMPIPSSSVTFPIYYNEEIFRKRWQGLLDPDSTAASRFPAVPLTDSGSTQHANLHHDAISRRSDEANNPRGTAQRTPISMPSAESHVDLSSSALGHDPNSSNNLETFLGTDADMGFIDAFNDDEFTSFDWNSWFESANGIS